MLSMTDRERPRPSWPRSGMLPVSTRDVLNRYVFALGGTLELIADFGGEQLEIA